MKHKNSENKLDYDALLQENIKLKKENKYLKFIEKEYYRDKSYLLPDMSKLDIKANILDL
jgi:hypothetical protein